MSISSIRLSAIIRVNATRPITCLIRALGLKTDAEILERFGDDERIVATLEKDGCKSYQPMKTKSSASEISSI